MSTAVKLLMNFMQIMWMLQKLNKEEKKKKKNQSLKMNSCGRLWGNLEFTENTDYQQEEQILKRLTFNYGQYGFLL